jgi:succinate dehydrogenase / fumarate reductase membrane anchor subunit
MKKINFWLIHLIAGFFIFFLLLWHTLYMHYPSLINQMGYGGASPLIFSEVIQRAKSNSFKIAYILFLIFVLYHAFYGLKNIILETEIGKRFENLVKILISIIAIILFVYGLFTTVKIGG